MTETRIATVEVPFEALAKELGTKRAIQFISEIRRKYGDSVVELRKATEKLTIETDRKRNQEAKERRQNINSVALHINTSQTSKIFR